MKFRVVIADSVAPDQEIERQILEEVADVTIAPPENPQGLHELLKLADGVLTCYTKFTEEMLLEMEKCQVIARSGIGVDTIPLSLATDRGIKVTNVPDYCIDEVADHTLTLMLALLRGLDPAIQSVRAGRWSFASAGALTRIRERTLGLIGFGSIAQAVARRAQAFGFRILVSDPYAPQETLDTFSATRVHQDQVLAQSDVVSLHVPLNDSTKHLINAHTLKLMRRNALLINTARGGLIDFSALKHALERGEIGGAGIDVLETEPPADLKSVAATSNLLLTPHLAFYSEESIRELREKSAREIVRVLKGKSPRYQVN